MISPYNAGYRDELDEAESLYERFTGVLFTANVMVWACIWGVIWLLSAVYVALHLHEDEGRSTTGAIDRESRL